jgi:2-polyprenyl-3-methyl-5-hydroxy-6-metoxy-1,4-benzoquinol methylase
MIKRRNALNIKFGMNAINQSKLSEQKHEVMVCAEANTADSLIGFLGDNLTGEILEVGAGYGVFSRSISKSATHLTSVEPNKIFYSDLQKQLEDIDNAEGFCGTLSDFVSSIGAGEVTKKFDRIMYTHVLEHIPDDVSELILARQQLQPNGKAIIVVPSLPRLYGPVDSLSGHQRRFTFNELK